MLARGRAGVAFRLAFVIWVQQQAVVRSQIAPLCPPFTYGSAGGMCYQQYYNNFNVINPCSCCNGYKRYWQLKQYSWLSDAWLCTICEVGKYQPEITSSTECISCPAGTYQNATRQYECIKCPAGKYSYEVGAYTLDTCTNCPAGKYSNIEGSGSNWNCIECQAGKYSTSGSSICTDCPANSNSDPNSRPQGCLCNMGYEPRLQSNINLPSLPLQCAACVAGKFKSTKSTWPTQASIWYIQDEQCQNCAAGAFAAMRV